MTDFIRVYEAQVLECNKCDNTEEGSALWGNFVWTNDKTVKETHGYYTCGDCGSNLITESDIREWRDEE
tara:strand:- start:924 stop:1130 length:207 start_codon:yes stop_codon:yes gene_type:complete